MTVTVNNPIVAPSRITAAQVKAWYVDNWGPVPTAVAQYLDEAERLCGAAGRSPALNMDFLLFVAQSVVETANPDTGKPWMSSRWLRNHNPAGLAVESDSDPDPATFTAKEAAVVQYWAWLYMTRKTSTQAHTPDSAHAFVERWTAKIEDSTFPYPVRTVADLCRHYVDSAGEPQSVWAWDETYATQLVARANEIASYVKEEPTMPTPTSALTFGLVPHPTFEDHPIRKAEGAGQNDLGQRTVKGVVWHRMIGSLRGTDSYFASPTVKSLTDYGIGVAAQDGADDDGVIIRWNDPLGRQSGWASGTYSSAAYGDGRAFAEKYGIDAINRDETSIEISGLTYSVPLSEKARQAIAAITAYWADQAKIPWTVFPITPADGFSFVRWHNEFGPDNGTKLCPGIVVMNETPALIERTRQIMRSYQVADIVVPNPPVYAPSELPDWWADSLTRLHPTDAVDTRGRWWVQRRNFECIKATTERRCRPDIKAKVSGPPVIAKEKIWAERLLEADRDWLVTTDGHYLLASAFNPSASLKTRKAKAA